MEVIQITKVMSGTKEADNVPTVWRALYGMLAVLLGKVCTVL